MNRRAFACMIPLAVTTNVLGQSACGLPTSGDILRSFDGQDWAKAFVAYAKDNPMIATDEATMTGWFANALMRGWDERERRYDEACNPRA